jgi:hypothetical protein
MLYGLLGDLEAWKTNLPDSLKFRGPETHRNAGERSVMALLSLFKRICVQVSCIYFIHVSA